MLSQLFKSQHFFDETAIGVIIKSPVDLYFNFLTETNFTHNDGLVLNILDAASLIGQRLFDPVDVAGWQRDREWISTNFMVGRWLTMETLVQLFYQEDTEQFRTLGIEATGPNGAIESDPAVVARAIIDKFLPKGLLTEADYTIAINVFREPFEDNAVYADDPGNPSGISSWNMLLEDANSQVLLLLLHLVKEPEFQLK